MYVLQDFKPDSQVTSESDARRPTVWKAIAICEELGQLIPHVKDANRRIINRDNLEVVYLFEEYGSNNRVQPAGITQFLPDLPG